MYLSFYLALALSLSGIDSASYLSKSTSIVTKIDREIGSYVRFAVGFLVCYLPLSSGISFFVMFFFLFLSSEEEEEENGACAPLHVLFSFVFDFVLSGVWISGVYVHLAFSFFFSACMHACR